MGILDSVKEVVQIVQKIDNIDLYRQILDLQSEIVKVVEENSSLREQVKALQEMLKVRESLRFESNSYWIEKEGAKEGPFCTHCWDQDGKLVRLHQDETQRWYCITHGQPMRVIKAH